MATLSKVHYKVPHNFPEERRAKYSFQVYHGQTDETFFFFLNGDECRFYTPISVLVYMNTSSKLRP